MAAGLTREASYRPLPEGLTRSPDACEREVLERWRREDTFRTVQEARAGAPSFVFWEGPPTANGRPGIHHLLARTVKDAVCRWQTMRGRRVVRKAGWDTQGLPVELEVEKALGISGKREIEAYGVAAFNAQCRQSVWTYKKEWEELSERIGYWLDYEHPYVTYEREYVESVWYVLKRFHDAGLVYRGLKVLPYCGRCGTSLSAHEMGQPGVYQEVRDPSVTVRFRLAEPDQDDEPESFLAWTTTPWTLPSNFALCVHPEREYVLAHVPLPVPKGAQPGERGWERVWVVRERAAAVLGEGFEELAARPGRELVGRAYERLFEVEPARLEPGQWTPDEAGRHRVYAGEFVTVEDGTGIVHQAPYGADDWDTARRFRLPLPAAVRGDGRFAETVGPVAAGTFYKDADQALMDDLKARGLLFRKAREPHSYPHCWRCKTPLYYYPTPAWFVRTTAYKDRMVAANARIQWVPAEIGTGRFGDWLENNVDWNVSRDRYWGTPLPFWLCERCGAERAVGSLAELRELAGGLPEDFDPHKPFVDEVTWACSCGGTLRRTPAVADVWLDSGSMPYAQYHWPHAPDSAQKLADQFPADFIAEGLDQTRGWFYTLHAVGTFLTSLADDHPELHQRDDAASAASAPGQPAPTPAFRSCVVNGLVLDRDGVKMSKSLGNVVDPWEALGGHGADAVRWYLLASGSPWQPKRYADDGVLEVRRRLFGTLVNSYRFLAEYARIDAFRPEDPGIPAPAARPEIDRWLVSRTQSTLRGFSERMDDYDLLGACSELEHFVVDELSNWYIRRNRRRFWKGETGADKLAAFATLHEALEAVALCLAPISPFLAELLWERLRPGAGSVHVQVFAAPREELSDPELELAMVGVQRIVEMGRALRERAGIRVRQPLRALHVRTSDARAIELLRSDFATAQILDELNVKAWGSLEVDDGEVAHLRARPNFRVLGKKLGPAIKKIGPVLERLGRAELESLRRGEPVAVPAPDGGAEPLVLGPEDVQIAVETTADFDVEADGRFVVWLDTALDSALVAEGLAREVVNRVNGLRRDRGLALEQRIHLRLDASGELMDTALAAHAELIAAETLAASVERVPEPFEGDAWTAWDLGDGRVLRASLSSAGGSASAGACSRGREC